MSVPEVPSVHAPLKVTGKPASLATIIDPLILVAFIALVIVIAPVVPVFPNPSLVTEASTTWLTPHTIAPVPNALLLLKFIPAPVSINVPPVKVFDP